jgi:hypothetical protein
VEKDDKFSFEEARFQRVKVRLHMLDQLLAALTIVSKPQTHIPNPSHVEEMNLLMKRKFKILFNVSWIGISTNL